VIYHPINGLRYCLPYLSPTLHRVLQDSSRAKCSGRVGQDSVKSRGQMSGERELHRSATMDTMDEMDEMDKISALLCSNQ